MCRDRINRLMSAYTLAVSKNRTDRTDNYPENAAFCRRIYTSRASLSAALYGFPQKLYCYNLLTSCRLTSCITDVY